MTKLTHQHRCTTSISCVASLPFRNPLMWPHGTVKCALNAWLTLCKQRMYLISARLLHSLDNLQCSQQICKCWRFENKTKGSKTKVMKWGEQHYAFWLILRHRYRATGVNSCWFHGASVPQFRPPKVYNVNFIMWTAGAGEGGSNRTWVQIRQSNQVWKHP